MKPTSVGSCLRHMEAALVTAERLLRTDENSDSQKQVIAKQLRGELLDAAYQLSSQDENSLLHTNEPAEFTKMREGNPEKRLAKRWADNPQLNPAVAVGLRGLLTALGKTSDELTRDELRKYAVWVGRCSWRPSQRSPPRLYYSRNSRHGFGRA